MENTAEPPVTETPSYTFLLTGHFQETVSYTNYRPHGTSDWLVIYTVAGCGRFGYDARRRELLAPAGAVTLLRPGVLHDYGTRRGQPDGWELLWAHFHPRPHWTDLLNWPEVAPGLMQIDLSAGPYLEPIEAVFRTLHGFATGGLPNRGLFAMAELEKLLLWCSLANPQGAHSGLDERVAAAVAHILANLGDSGLRIDEISEKLCVSPSRLAHLFREQMGASLQRFVELQRMERARQLLTATARPVQAIASEVGYESPFYFSLRFKKLTGVSPTQFRARSSAAEYVMRR